jgi:glutamate-1-semialdehyde 2,1-aminomutase
MLSDLGPHLGLPHPGEVRLSQELTGLIPCAEKVALCGGGGSDPCYHAVRLSRAYTRRQKIIKFEGGHNGWADLLSMSINPRAEESGPYDTPNTGASPGTLPAVVGNTCILPANNAALLERCLARHGCDISAIIIEPIMQGMGAAYGSIRTISNCFANCAAITGSF